MKLTQEEMVQIAVKVCSSRKLSKQQCSVLIGMAEFSDRLCTCEQIASGLQKHGYPKATRHSVRVALFYLRKNIAGTGLSMKSSMGRGGGIVLQYDPAP